MPETASGSASERIERHEAEWFQAQAVVPGAEVHADPDVTWVLRPGRAWGNAGTRIRLAPESAPRRLDHLVARYRAHGRGMGLWVSPAATPAELPRLLRARGLLCRRRFPAMLRDLVASPPEPRPVAGVEIRSVEDPSVFLETPHPTIGPVTTAFRRHALEALRALAAERPQRVWPFVAWMDGRPVAASLLFVGSECAGLHDLTVSPALRGRGVGSALLEHTCAEALRHGATSMSLLATTDGERLYRRRGFVEASRFAFWYRSSTR